MRILIVFPPRAYSRIPYLAPWLLKGFIQSNSTHSADCVDLNIDYHHQIWSGLLFTRYCSALPENLTRLVNLVVKWGPTAYANMRDHASYTSGNRNLLQMSNDMLLSAENLEQKISASLGANEQILPTRYNQWADLLNQWNLGLLARYIADAALDINAEAYDVIGFSCAYLEQIVPSLLLARQLRSLSWPGKLVIGGSGFTKIHHETIKDPSFWDHLDFGIPYEGEVTLLAALNGLQQNNDSFMNENVVSRNGSDVRFNNRIMQRSVVHPVPDFSDLPTKFPTPETIYPVLISKGCYWGKCAFCTHHEGYGQGYSPGDLSVLSQTIEHVFCLGGNYFYFVDEALSAKGVHSLAQTFLRHSNSNSSLSPVWMAECRVEKYTATESFTRELYHSGCRLLINGMETGSQRIMHLIRKGVDLERGKGYLQLCQNAGIRTGWMFFIGFPGETLEEAEETFRYIESCESELNFTSIGTYSLERDSPVWNDPSSFGITEIIGKDEPYRLQFDYVDQNGVLHQRHTLDKLLARMISEYPRLLTKLCAIVDRSCGVFFDETN